MGLRDILRKLQQVEPAKEPQCEYQSDVEVAGEAYHAEAFAAIFCTADRPGGGVIIRTATLVPEPENPFDDTAVAVYIEGLRVGYVPRADEATKSRAIAASIDDKNLEVLARVWSRNDNGAWVSRVTLSFSGETEPEWSYAVEQDDLYPDDDFRDVEVIGESNHRESFAEIFGRAGWPFGGVLMRNAALIPDPEHPYSNEKIGIAVAVHVEGLVVGYVPHGDLSTKKRAWDSHATGKHFIVPVRIWARNDDGVWRARVTLSFSGLTEDEWPYVDSG
ncbi:hypothetical protein ABW16_22625 [Mycolicibacter heraklionensis]|uniref:HIRAN domain-containing protein n=1 Tax=Mycolicibacter heraklionensis TaxID=512402 RepID=A0ABR5F9I3_9MYCO|nr:HIRAN domain-containing protein [Mycolicibacter heraklionensis]KLO25544.1 hypothetical protein ABW16_22625 [Mycolicibacter heraklionensis]